VESDILERHDATPEDALIGWARQAGHGEACVAIIHPSAEIIDLNVTSNRHLHCAGSDEVICDAGQQALKRQLTGLQELMGMGALADAEPRSVVMQKNVAIDDEDIRHMLRQGGCSGQSADTGTDDDGFGPFCHGSIPYRHLHLWRSSRQIARKA
jgi:hypothetical protein